MKDNIELFPKWRENHSVDEFLAEMSEYFPLKNLEIEGAVLIWQIKKSGLMYVDYNLWGFNTFECVGVLTRAITVVFENAGGDS